jgi:hypothetical protein
MRYRFTSAFKTKLSTKTKSNLHKKKIILFFITKKQLFITLYTYPLRNYDYGIYLDNISFVIRNAAWNA